MTGPDPIIGIDFGTSKSTVAWYNAETGRAQILTNAEGEQKTPSVVYFGERETLVGTPAMRMLDDPLERGRVVLSVKRDIGKPGLIGLPGAGECMRPVDVATEILRKLKRDAEELYFYQAVTRAVMAFPASYGPLERDKIAEATHAAGFAEVTLIEEPVAAALAYAHEGLHVGNHVLVYDLGAGTLDLAILAREEDGRFHVALPPKGIANCGGDDFDRALYDYCDALAMKELGRPISLNDELDLHFLHICANRKEELTTGKTCTFNELLLSGDGGAVLFKCTVDRATFNGLIGPLVLPTVESTRALLAEGRAQGHPVDMVVLIGGSSRVPLVQQRLQETLRSELNLRKFGGMDVAVALGAAYSTVPQCQQQDEHQLADERRQGAGEQEYREAVARALADKKPQRAEVDRLHTQGGTLQLSMDRMEAIERETLGMSLHMILATGQYRDAVSTAWAGGVPPGAEIARLRAWAAGLGLSREQADGIERSILGMPMGEIVYRRAVTAAWAKRKPERVEVDALRQLATDLEVYAQDADAIEQSILGLTMNVILACDRYRARLAFVRSDRTLDQVEANQLSGLAEALALTRDQTAAIERAVLGDTKEAILQRQSRNVPASRE